jgi:hypothetical protein
MVVATDNLLADDSCRFWSQTLIFEAYPVISLMKHHLSYKPFLLLVNFAAESKVLTLSLV